MHSVSQQSSMAITTLCAVVAALRVLPNRAQFFKHESVSLSCELQGNSSVWTLKRNTTDLNDQCSLSGDGRNGCHCFIEDLYPSDTAAYWCESAAGERSRAVSIAVTAGPVILESPALPVMEGDDVTLRCTSTETSSQLTADFYKDGLLIRSSSTGNMTIVGVSESDEGVYKCNVSGAESPDSRLTVRRKTTGRPEPPQAALVNIVLPVVVVCLSLLLAMLFCLWRSHKVLVEEDFTFEPAVASDSYFGHLDHDKDKRCTLGKVNSDVSYTDVIVTQQVKPTRIRDGEPTFYSAVKPCRTVPVWKCTYSNYSNSAEETSSSPRRETSLQEGASQQPPPSLIDGLE